MVGKVLVGDGQGAAAGKLIDGGAPVVEWQGGVVDELRWSKAKLLGCLEGTGWRCNNGSTAGRNSSELEESTVGFGRRWGSAWPFIGQMWEG